MYGRPTILFPLVLLALLAVLTLWIDRAVQPPAPKLDGSARHDPDYILNNFVTTKTDVNGNLRYKLIAEEMRHYPDHDTTELQHPHFTRYDINKPYTQVEGERGLVSSDGENIQFMDNVKVVRQASADRGEMVMLTQYLNLTPKKELATTDKPVVITQAPKTVIHGTGMIYDKKQKTMRLLSKVKVHYERPPQTRNSSPSKVNPKISSKVNKDQKITVAGNKTSKVQSGSKQVGTAAKTQQKNASKKILQSTSSTQKTTRIRRQYEHAQTQP
jgi:lipopolysaccharide export system protein LptC